MTPEVTKRRTRLGNHSFCRLVLNKTNRDIVLGIHNVLVAWLYACVRGTRSSHSVDTYIRTLLIAGKVRDCVRDGRCLVTHTSRAATGRRGLGL